MILIKTKQQIRRELKEKRKSASTNSNSITSEKILENILQLVNPAPIDNIGMYWPLNGEPDLSKLFVLFSSKISLPKLGSDGLYFVKYQTGDKVDKIDHIDLYQPASNYKITPSVIILPGIAFDLKGYRIGFGSGHYDKYIAEQTKPILTIGVCFHEFLIENTLPEPHDQKLSFIVTDKIILRT